MSTKMWMFGKSTKRRTRLSPILDSCEPSDVFPKILLSQLLNVDMLSVSRHMHQESCIAFLTFDYTPEINS